MWVYLDFIQKTAKSLNRNLQIWGPWTLWERDYWIQCIWDLSILLKTARTRQCWLHVARAATHVPHIHIHTYTHIHLRRRIRVRIHRNTHIHKHTYNTYTDTCTCTCTCTHTFTYTYTSTYTSHTYMYTYT